MNKHLLEELAERILSEQNQEELFRLTIVLPSRRAGLFLRKYLLKNIGKPFISPRIITINELVEEIAGVQSCNSIILLFELYETYRKTESSNSEPFELFSKWAQIMLSDFNEIDRYLINAKDLFRDLKNIQEIENWSFNTDELSPSQENYRSFWLKMGEYYENFKRHCEEKNIFTSGHIYRKAAMLIDEKVNSFTNNSVYFTGFNAISASEEKIIETLCKHQKAFFIADGDALYVEDKNHEAGIFIRQLQNKNWFPKTDFPSYFSESEKQINIYSTPGNTLQADVAGQILTEFSPEELNQTVLVLADESMLLPVINSLPTNASLVNITMGYSLKNTSLFTFIHSLFENQRRIRVSPEGKIKYYVADLTDILNNSECIRLTNGKSTEISNQILELSKNYLTHEEFTSCINDFPELLPIIEIWPENGAEITIRIINTLEKLHFLYSGNKSLQLETVFTAIQALKTLQMLLANYPFCNDIKTLHRLCLQILKTENIPFYGEPLQGIQILGMLEARALDFKNVIILSVNEGIVPQGNAMQSLIPYDLKRFYHLPTWHESDAVFAHHFYRLIQRAENIHLVYNSSSDKTGGGEKSRFILQIEEEFRVHKNIKITKIIPQFTKEKTENLMHAVKNTPSIIKKLNDMFEKGISPTAISAYLECPLNFYYNYIIGLREEEASENAGAAEFGTILHNTMDHLYKPFLNTVLSPDIFTILNKQVDAVSQHYFIEEMGNSDFQTGKNFLTLNILRKYCRKILNHDEQLSTNGELIIIDSEKIVAENYTIPFKNAEITIKLKGITDRIDRLNGKLRLIDYKTGQTEQKDLKFKDENDLADKPKSVQLLIYALNYLKINNIEIIEAFHYALRQTGSIEIPLLINTQNEITLNDQHYLQKLLEQVIPELLNDDFVFEHQPKSKYCSFCQ